MGLFTLHNCFFLWLLNFLNLKLHSQSRLTVPEFSGYHCSLAKLAVRIKVLGQYWCIKWFSGGRDFKHGEISAKG